MRGRRSCERANRSPLHGGHTYDPGRVDGRWAATAPSRRPVPAARRVPWSGAVRCRRVTVCPALMPKRWTQGWWASRRLDW